MFNELLAAVASDSSFWQTMADLWRASSGLLDFLGNLWAAFFTTTNIWSRVATATWETIYIVGISSLVAALGGIPLGVILVASREGHVLGKLWRVNAALSAVVNILRSIPFIIFMVFIMPVTGLVVGTGIGTTAATFCLAIAAVVFTARLAESAILEVPSGLIEAAQSTGANAWQIIWRVMLPEARSGLVAAMTITIITLIGYSAMAGTVGGGGLGNRAINYGHYRYQYDVILVTVVILVVMVQGIQSAGDALAKKLNKK